MKLITSTLLSLFFACSVALGQGTLTITDNGSHIILNVEGKPTSYPKNELTVQQKGTQAIIFKQRGLVVQQINSIAKVTSPTSVSMSDLFGKIIAMFPASGGSGIPSNDADILHKSGTETATGAKTFTQNLTLGANLNITGQVNSTQTATSAIANFTPGTLKTTPIAGDFEVNGDTWTYALPSNASRKTVVFNDITPGTSAIPYYTSTGRLTWGSGFAFNVTGGAGRLSVSTGSTTGILNVGSPALTSGNSPLSVFTAAAHTNQTASTEVIDNYWNGSATLQFATGNFATQRTNVFTPRTYSAVGASTITDAATLVVTGASIPGANMTITNPKSFWVQSGISRFDGPIQGAQGLLISQTATFNNNASVNGTLGVTGATTIASTLELTSSNGTIYLKSPNGTRYSLQISNAGAVTVTAAP